jgi:hypothetical protein
VFQEFLRHQLAGHTVPLRGAVITPSRLSNPPLVLHCTPRPHWCYPIPILLHPFPSLLAPQLSSSPPFPFTPAVVRSTTAPAGRPDQGEGVPPGSGGSPAAASGNRTQVTAKQSLGYGSTGSQHPSAGRVSLEPRFALYCISKAPIERPHAPQIAISYS